MTQAQTNCTIPEHWDTLGIITAQSDSRAEFAAWQEHAATDPEWTGDEFTEADFAAWIESLEDTQTARDDADQQWLDENVTSYEPGSIPVDLTARQAKREIFCGHEWESFLSVYGEQKNYRARLLFEWLGY